MGGVAGEGGCKEGRVEEGGLVVMVVVVEEDGEEAFVVLGMRREVSQWKGCVRSTPASHPLNGLPTRFLT